MALQRRRGIAVAVEAKGVESRLHSELQIGAAAAMAMDAVVEPSAIRIVVVARQTIDGRVLAMIEVQRQRVGAAQQRFAQLGAGAARNEGNERERRGGDDTGDERGMAAGVAGRRLLLNSMAIPPAATATNTMRRA
jgi:hypothetical protein